MKNNNKNTKNPNGNINLKISVMIGILVLLTCGCTYLFYNMFDGKYPSIITRLEMDLSNASKTIDSVGASYHKFKIYNRSNLSARYRVIYYDRITGSPLIDRSDIHYELYLNDSIIKKGVISDLAGDVLNSRTIDSKETDNYNLKVWIDEEKFAKGVNYTYNLKILPMED